MKYWDRSLLRLEQSGKTLEAIYNVVFSFGQNTFFESNSAGRIMRMTYDECRMCALAAAERIAAQLSSAPKDSFVALALDNSPEWVIAFWAILMSGHRPLLVNMRVDADSNARILASANVVSVVGKEPLAEFSFIDASGFSRHPESRSDFKPHFADGIAVCTSGTTGLPKLAVYDGAAISAQILNSQYVLKKNPSINTYYCGELKLLAVLPFYHIFGLVANLMWFSFFGRTFVFVRDMAPSTLADACKRHGVTHIFAIPLMFNMVSQQVMKKAQEKKKVASFEKAMALSLLLQSVFPRTGAAVVRGTLMRSLRRQVLGESVRFCITGGAYVPKETLRVMNALGYSLYNGYGTTEAGIASVELRRSAKRRLDGSIGVPFPSAQYDIVDGELLIKGDSLCSAVYDNGVLYPRERGSWLHTGDMAQRDEAGYYYLDGRRDDMIVTEGGENISPDALESAFANKHIKHLCIVRAQTCDAGSMNTLVVEEQPNISTHQHNKLLCSLYASNSALPMDHKVRRVLIVSEPLPTVMDMKVQRGEVRKRLALGTLRFYEVRLSDYCSVENVNRADFTDTLAGVIEVFAKVFERQASDILPDMHLVYDLGCNSMLFFSLTEELGTRFDISFTLSEDSLPATPREFAQYIINQS